MAHFDTIGKKGSSQLKDIESRSDIAFYSLLHL